MIFQRNDPQPPEKPTRTTATSKKPGATSPHTPAGMQVFTDFASI